MRQRENLAREADELTRSRAELQSRLSELVALNEVAEAVSSTLDLDELLDVALAGDRRPPAVRSGAGAARRRGARQARRRPEHRRRRGRPPRSSGRSRCRSTRSARRSSSWPPRTARSCSATSTRIPYEPNRAFARALDVSSFLGTPLQTKGRTVGVLAVDNRLSGRDVERSMGPLLFTVGNLLAEAVDNARLYAQVEEANRELEARVATRTAQLAEMTQEAQAARATAEAASATKSQFLANVSHELRTPLTSIVGFTKIVRKRIDEVVLPALVAARDGADTDPKLDRAVRQVGDNLEIVAAEGDRLTALVTEVLDLEKIEAGKMEFRDEPVDVADVRRAGDGGDVGPLRDDRARAPPRRRGRIADGPGRRPPPRPGRDQPPVERGEVHAVRLRDGRAATAADDPATVVVSVADTGTGIAPEDQERVFEQFAQAGDTLSETPRGTGPRAGDQPPDRRAPRRPDLARERGRRRLDVPVQPARRDGVMERRRSLVVGDPVERRPARLLAASSRTRGVRNTRAT